MRTLILLLLASLCLNTNAQLFKTKNEAVKNETERKKIAALKIREVKAYIYAYNKGKIGDNGELAEYKKYNQDGFVTELYSSVNPEYITEMSIKITYRYENNLRTSSIEECKMGSFETKSQANYTYSTNNLIKEVANSSAANMNFSISKGYVYDDNQNLTNMSFTSSGNTFEYKYKLDDKGNIATQKGPNMLHTYTYDAQNNLTFINENSDMNGVCQTNYVYDSNNNLVEYERIQVSSPAGTEWMNGRYKHCLFTYKNNLLTQRFDKNQAGDTICVIKYEYLYNGNYSVIVNELIQEKMTEWLKKNKYESTQDYQLRISDANKAKQTEEFRKISINELGKKRYSFKPLKMDYDADKEIFSISFEELSPVNIYVPRIEAEDFEKNKENLQFEPKFSLVQDNFVLNNCSVKNPNINKEYNSK